MAKPKLGTGQRFSALTQQLASKPGVRDPKALAAAIGRKKFGKKQMFAMAKGAKQ